MTTRIVRIANSLPELQILQRNGASSGRNRARARGAVVAGVVAFVGGQMLLNLGISQEILPIRDPVFFEKRDFLRAHPQFFGTSRDRDSAVSLATSSDNTASPVRVVALGTSRTQLAFDAGRFAESATPLADRRVEAFNFGVPAGGPLTSAIYLRRLLADGFAPDVLLIEIHPCFVAPMDPPFEARWLHGFRLRPEEIPILRGFGWQVESPPHHGWRGWAAAAYSYRLGLLNHYAPVMLPCPYGLHAGVKTDPFGYVEGIELPPSQKPRALQRTREQYLPVLENYRIGGAGVEAFRDILTLCRDRGIRTAIVLTPESSEFRGWYGQAGYAMIGKFATELGREFASPVFDGREWVPDSGIADGHHLTSAGAKVFSDRLAKECGPWLAKGGRR